MSTAEQILIRDLKEISIKVDNADAFFAKEDSNPEVDQVALYELMEMDGAEKTALVEAAYAKFHQSSAS